MSTVASRAARAAPLAVVGPLLLLGACASSTYVPPTSGPTARVLVRAAVSGNDLFGLLIHDDPVGCTGPRAATTGRATRAPVAVTVAAGRLQTIELLFVKPDSKQTCSVRSSITPVAGKTYLYVGTLNASGCNLRVLDASQPDDMKPDLTAVRRSVGSNRCVAMADAKPLSQTGSARRASDEAVLAPNATSDDLSDLIGR